MPASTALAFRQTINTVDHSGNGAGQQWNNLLYELYHYFFTTAEAVDTGRWLLVDHSLAAPANWNTLANVVDNSWFVVRSAFGRNPWEAKFQSSNVAALDEAPAATYRWVVSFSADGGWRAKGGINNGFGDSSLTSPGNRILGGSNISGNPNGSIVVAGDRDTVLISATLQAKAQWDCGGYVGRYTPDNSAIVYPMCVLAAWNGVGAPAGFDRSAGGAFAASPGGSCCTDHNLAVDTVGISTASWLTSTFMPSPFSSEYHFRPFEVTSSAAYLGTLRHVWATGALAALSRIDSRRKLVLHGNAIDSGVAISHNGASL